MTPRDLTRPRAPQLPAALWAARPDPRRRRAYFAWCERCRSWWVDGIGQERATQAWAVLVAARGEDAAREPLVIAKTGGVAVRVVADGVVIRGWVPPPLSGWTGHLIAANAYRIRQTHPELSRIAARTEALARRAWHRRNPGRTVANGRMLAEHLAVLAARGD